MGASSLHAQEPQLMRSSGEQLRLSQRSSRCMIELAVIGNHPRRHSIVQRCLAWLGRNRGLVEDFEGSVVSDTNLLLRRFGIGTVRTTWWFRTSSGLDSELPSPCPPEKVLDMLRTACLRRSRPRSRHSGFGQTCSFRSAPRSAGAAFADDHQKRTFAQFEMSVHLVN
jgi:hypothetical protein